MLQMQTLLTIDLPYSRHLEDVACDLAPGLVHDCYGQDGSTKLWSVHPHNGDDDHGGGAEATSWQTLLTPMFGPVAITVDETIVWAPDGVTCEVLERLHQLDPTDDRAELELLQAHAIEQADAALEHFVGQIRQLLGN